MSYKTTIYIIKTRTNNRQVKFSNFLIGEFNDLQEATDFAINYEFGLDIEVYDGDMLIDTIDKSM